MGVKDPLAQVSDLFQQAGVEPRFAAELVGLAEMAMRKGADYSPGADPYENAKSSEGLGVPAWLGIAIRMGDKFRRLQALALNGALKNEPIEDTLTDIAVYALICKIIRSEAVA